MVSPSILPNKNTTCSSLDWVLINWRNRAGLNFIFTLKLHLIHAINRYCDDLRLIVSGFCDQSHNLTFGKLAQPDRGELFAHALIVHHYDLQVNEKPNC